MRVVVEVALQGRRWVVVEELELVVAVVVAAVVVVAVVAVVEVVVVVDFVAL